MKFLCLAYGDEKDWASLSQRERDERLQADENIRRRGALMGAVQSAAVVVTVGDAEPHVVRRAFATAKPPLAGFSIVEAENLEQVSKLVAGTPCARAQGAVEIRPIIAVSDFTVSNSEPTSPIARRPNTALLVVDVQTGVVEQAYQRDIVVANIAHLVKRARRESVPVVWVQHADERLVKGSDNWRIAPELTPTDAEPIIAKGFGDSFEDTKLEEVLSSLAVGRLVLVGAQTDFCIRSTLHGAFARGYDVTLVSDAHTTGDLTRWGAPPPQQVIAHMNFYWSYQKAPGRMAAAVATQNVTL